MFNEVNQLEFFGALARFQFTAEQLSEMSNSLVISSKILLEQGKTKASQHVLLMSCVTDAMLDSKIYDTKA